MCWCSPKMISYVLPDVKVTRPVNTVGYHSS